RIGPVSAPFSMTCQVIPCSGSPRIKAHTGALSPAYFGKGPSWKLIASREGIASSQSGTIRRFVMLKRYSNGTDASSPRMPSKPLNHEGALRAPLDDAPVLCDDGLDRVPARQEALAALDQQGLLAEDDTVERPGFALHRQAIACARAGDRSATSTTQLVMFETISRWYLGCVMM